MSSPDLQADGARSISPAYDRDHWPAGTDLKAEGTVAVIIATMNRPRELKQTVDALNRQTNIPRVIILSAVDERDVVETQEYRNVVVLFCAAGSCVQRNRALDYVAKREDIDIVCFFDDDYIPSRFALENIERLFRENDNVAGATGALLADGINGGGISMDLAEKILEVHDEAHPRRHYLTRVSSTGLYGCNMVFRRNSIAMERFDEKLPLYGWQEDIDFATRVAKRGKLVWTDIFAGVHRGVKNGRSSGLRVGYSQIANPIYLLRKGTMPFSFALKLMIGNLTANLFRSLYPEPWLDRRGRMRGNFIALMDIGRGRLDPRRILEIE